MQPTNIVTVRRTASVVSFHSSLEGIHACSAALRQLHIFEEHGVHHVVGNKGSLFHSCSKQEESSR
jgi:hypothetical protein